MKEIEDEGLARMKKALLITGCLALSLGLYTYHYFGVVLSEGIGRSLREGHVPFTESTDLSAKLALPGAITFLGCAIWLILGPSIRKNMGFDTARTARQIIRPFEFLTKAGLRENHRF
jgi:hypothetical protein